MSIDHNTQRIMIIGQPGSGKSTLARVIGDITGLPVFHIDRIHWTPGWIERAGAEKDRLCHEVHIQDHWVFEGGRSSTWPARLQRADAIIWLDFPLSVRAWRVFTRTLKHYGESRPDLPDDCPERFDWEFTHWIWRTRKTNRISNKQFFDNAPDTKQKFRLCNRREVARFTEQLPGQIFSDH